VMIARIVTAQLKGGREAASALPIRILAVARGSVRGRIASSQTAMLPLLLISDIGGNYTESAAQTNTDGYQPRVSATAGMSCAAIF